MKQVDLVFHKEVVHSLLEQHFDGASFSGGQYLDSLAVGG